MEAKMLTFILLLIIFIYNFSVVSVELKSSKPAFLRVVFLMIFGIIEDIIFNFKFSQR